jgi:acyl-CoA dehydrogenase
MLAAPPEENPVAIDFTLPEDVEDVRARIVDFMEHEVRPTEERLRQGQDLRAWRPALQELREKARAAGLWAPHMPREYGGMGLGPLAMAFVSAECGRTQFGAYVLNCHAPDEGNMHTLLHFATDAQKQKYLRPLVDGEVRSCFSLTEPDVAGSDPTGIQTTAVQDGDHFVINGRKWFTSGARGAAFAIVIAHTDPDANPPQARNTAFIVDADTPGFHIVRDIETMAGRGNHCEIEYRNVRVPAENILGGRGNGHRLGQVRLGPARLAHCMRWIGNAERGLEMLVGRALARKLHGGVLADKQGIQWMMAESALELYQCKLMVLHSAYLIENQRDFRQEVSMTKHHVANTLWRVLDRAIQVHGALGYSTDSDLASMMTHARSARLVDGADEVHLSRIAENVIEAFEETGSTRDATGRGLL